MSKAQHQGEAPVSLFEELPAVDARQEQAARQVRNSAKRQGAARLLQTKRRQIELRASDLESLVGEDHLGRLVWGYVERQDLSRLVEAIKARGGNAGRSAIDPRILFALWLYAVLGGVGSGREVARLTREHDAYRWICGGVSVNYHALNDFRSGSEVLMDEVLTANVRNGDKAEDARASTTDADARVMKMGDGGFRPAFNVQLATTCQDPVIVGVAVTDVGSDMAQMAPMVEQVIERSGSTPAQWLVDGGFPAHEQIDAVHERTGGETEVLAPVPEPKAKRGLNGDDVPPPDKHQPKDDDSVPVAQWRARMACADNKEIDKQRAATAECVNALARNRGLQRLPVRGLVKVRVGAMLYALAHNLMRMAKIAPQLIGLGTGASSMAAAAA
jgi:transposase